MADANTTNFLTLPDGRRLCYAEYGDPAGEPVFLFHGNPGSRISWGLYPGSPFIQNARLIAPDRPGYARSDFRRNAIEYWPQDVATLADHLKIERFHLFSPSGGGPYALACAWQIPQRLKSVGIFGSVGPNEPEAVAGVKRPLRILWKIANPLFPLVKLQNRIIAGRVTKNPQALIDAVRDLELSEVDRPIAEKKEIREIIARVLPESYLQNGIGSAHDYCLPARWPIPLKEIRTRVLCWQAGHDAMTGNMTAYIADQIPDAELIHLPDAGHLWIMEHVAEVLERLMQSS